ncbi:MAG: tetratricopeptide repeat protein [Chloroflexota bacterium]
MTPAKQKTGNSRPKGRDDFSARVVATLARRANYICSNPDCRKPTAGPHSDPEKAMSIGVAAHICAAAPGGPRYDSTQTQAERASIENGIWLCQDCSVRIDRDPGNFPADLLRKWKKEHEEWVRQTEHLRSDEKSELIRLHQLPQPPADFTGRKTQIDELQNDFQSHKGAAISGLTGMGGIGKTALGLVAAHEIAEEYPDAQIFMDLKGTTTPLSATDVMRHVLLSFEPTADLRALDDANMSAAYQSALHGKRVLLFLDNARSAEQIAPLRPPETCAMLVTSRWTFTVPGLQSRRVDVLSADDAKAFLLELCPRIKEKATELAKACAYLPLALRIAGSFLQVNQDWPIEKYLAQLNDRKKRLAMLKKSREEAELTSEPDLLATFDLSYSQLAEEEQRCWRILGVFPASFAWTAAAAMWELEEDATTKLLGLLKRYSLLEYDEISSRYGLHDLLADYALSQMEDGEEQPSRQKHAAHYREVMSVADALYLQGGEKILVGLRLLDAEWGHIRSAQAWISENIDASAQVTGFAMQYPSAAAYCLDLRLTPRQRIQWLELAIVAARKLENKEYEGIHLSALGIAYKDLGEVRKAIELFEQALVIAREIGDEPNGGLWLGNLGNAYVDLGDTHKAIEFLEQALVIVRKIGNRRGEGDVLNNLGLAYAISGRKGAMGDMRKAIEFFKQALVIAREIGDRRSESADLGNLGNAYNNLGEVRKAIEFHKQALVIAREIGDRRGEGADLGNLGSAYFMLNDYAKAGDYYSQVIVIAQEIGHKSSEANALWGLALCKERTEKLEDAREILQKALYIFREIESPSAITIQKLLDNLDR